MGYWSVVLPQAAVNLIDNPSVETNATGWGVNGIDTGERSSTYAKFGAYSYRAYEAEIEATGETVYVNTTGIAVTVGTTYTYSVYIKKTICTGTGRVAIDWYTSGVAYISTSYTTMDSGAHDWARYEVTAEAPATAALAYLRVQTTGMTATTEMEIYVDGAQFETGSTATTYLDGDQLGCEWAGTKHASISSRSALSRAGGMVKDLEDYGAYTVKMSGFGMPPLTWNTQERALIPGATVQSVKAKPRALAITFDVEGTSLSNYHSIRDDLIEAFKPNRVPLVDGKPQPVLLQYTGAGPTVEIEAYYAGGLDGDLEQGFGEKVAVLLIANDPYFYAPGNGSAGLTYTQTSTNAGNIIRRVDGTWAAMGSGSTETVRAIAIGPNHTVYAGSDSTSLGGVSTSPYIAQWTPQSSAWSGMVNGALGIPQALITDAAGNVYVAAQGGASTSVQISKWNGSAFESVGVGTNNTAIRSFAMGQDGTLYLGGDFTTCGEAANADYVAKWNGSTFGALTTNPPDSLVYALTVVQNGDLYIGGAFSSAGGSSAACYAAKWTPGSTTLEALTTTPLNNTVYALCPAEDGSVYLGGSFTTAGGVSGADYICRYDGQRYLPLAGGVNGTVQKMILGDDGLLYVGGAFTQAGDLTITERVACWNGYSWAHLPVDLPAGVTIYAIASESTALYLGYDNSTAAAEVTHSALNTVTNNGSAEAYPKVTFKCETTGTVLPVVEWVKNENTNKTLYMNYTLQKGETLTVDTEQHTVKSDYFGKVPRAILPNSDLGSFSLLPGSNNLSVFVTGTSTQCTVSATWQERYWSPDGVST